jgi:hypothetical protein
VGWSVTVQIQALWKEHKWDKRITSRRNLDE